MLNRRMRRDTSEKLTRFAKQGDPVAAAVCALQLDPKLLDAYKSGYREPKDHEEAMSTEDRIQWAEAEMQELHSMLKNKVYQLVNTDPSKKAIPCKWVYKRKRDSMGHVQRFKARLVAKGFYQVFGQDYTDTYSPVTRLTSMRIIYALSVLLNMKLHQLDVETAFLNADLEPGADIYIDPPAPIEAPVGKAFKLKKSLYGLKQAPLNWNLNINKYLNEIGFTRLTSDQCLYVKGSTEKKKDYVIVALYVDDIIITSNSDEAIDRVIKQFQNRYKMKDLGNIQNILGTQVTAGPGTYTTTTFS